MGADPLGEPAKVANDGGLGLGAQVLGPRQTLSAVGAASRVPAHAHPLANLDIQRVVPHRDHPADDLVARHKRVNRVAPLIPQDRKVGVAEPARLDGDFDLGRTERARVVGERFEFGVLRLGGPGTDLAHGVGKSRGGVLKGP